MEREITGRCFNPFLVAVPKYPRMGAVARVLLYLGSGASLDMHSVSVPGEVLERSFSSSSYSSSQLICVFMCECMHVYVYVYVCLCVYIFVRVYMCEHECVYVCVCSCVRVLVSAYV